uniref:C3H1-type domain-containing protein n=1 Tax=Ditylenchus dipsaci TaxID=166011 RepID=A0A915ER61_9BILA
MLIEQDEQLLAWIREQVVLICDAEPTAFAKYVLALLRKSSTQKDGRQLCNTQLEVFLQTNTESFVDKLFFVLEEKSYLKQEQPELIRKPSPVLELTDISPEKEVVPTDFKQPEGEDTHHNLNKFTSNYRPRIQPPEKRPEEEEQAEENLLKAQRLIQMSTNGKRRSIVGLNRVGGNLLRPATRRYMVREDQRSSKSWSRSRSPIRESRTSDIQDIFVGGKHRRCRNYEVLGYCLRGNQCPFRHETTPITVTAPPGNSYGGPTSNYSTNLANQAYNPKHRH